MSSRLADDLMIDRRGTVAPISSSHATSGDRLRRLREERGRSLRSVARAVGVRPRDLRHFEGGRRPVPADVRERLAGALDVPVAELVPVRGPSEIEVADGAVKVGPVERRLSERPTSDDVLGGYLHMVYELRGLRPGDPLPLRDEDLDHLARALGDDAATIESRLIELIGCSAAEAERLRKILMRRRLVVPAAGVALGVAGLNAGALADALGGSDADETRPTTTTQVFEPAAVDAPVPTTAPPTTAPPTTSAPPPPTTAAVEADPGVEREPVIGDPLVIERDDVQAGSNDDVEIGDPLVIEREPEEPTPGEVEIGEALVIERDPADSSSGEQPEPEVGGSYTIEREDAAGGEQSPDGDPPTGSTS